MTYLATRRIAFTIVEILVAMSLVAVLTSLLIPAVQSARETARRSACQSNLRQIAFATLNHEQSHRQLPTGADSQRFPGDIAGTLGISWWVEIMPEMEQVGLFAQFDRNSRNSGSVLFHRANGNAVNGWKLETLLCPSSRVPHFWPVGQFQLLMPSYVGIAGASRDDKFIERRINDCCEPKRDGQISAGGLLISNRAVKLEQVHDGLSNVLLIAEASDYMNDPQGIEQRVDGGFNYGWITGTTAAGTPPDYGQNAPPPSWNITTLRYQINERDYSLPGVMNARGPNNPLVSPHPGGVNLSFGDASSRFYITDTDVTTLKRLATRDDGAAASPY